jgi:hypothetical protein
MKIITSVSKEFKPVFDLTRSYMSKDIIVYSLADRNNDMEFGSKDFNLLGTKEEESIYSKIKDMVNGDIFFQCDSDVLINAPTEWFIEQLGDNDIIFQSDSGTPCLGFYVTRISDEVKRIFKDVKEKTNEKTNCQIVFNRIKKNYNLKIALFDTKDVWNYGVLNKGIWRGESFELPENLKAFHANFTIGIENKVKLLNIAIKKYK